MTKWRRQLEHELGPDGIVTRTGSGHYKLMLPNGRTVIASSTPSDWRALQHVRADIRRAMRSTQFPPVAPEIETAAPQPATVIVEQPGELEVPPFHSGLVYHFTDTAHLPAIIVDGQISPLDEDVLWATTNPAGDRCANTAYDAFRKPFEKGLCREVRITAGAEDFRDDWQKAPQLSSRPLWWTAEQMRESARPRRQSTVCWRWRPDALDIDRCLIETRGRGERQWTSVTEFSILILPMKDFAAIRVDDHIYLSRFNVRWGHERGEMVRVCQVFAPVHISDLEYLMRIMRDHPSRPHPSDPKTTYDRDRDHHRSCRWPASGRWPIGAISCWRHRARRSSIAPASSLRSAPNQPTRSPCATRAPIPGACVPGSRWRSLTPGLVPDTFRAWT
jgi:hypothetical protein